MATLTTAAHPLLRALLEKELQPAVTTGCAMNKCSKELAQQMRSHCTGVAARPLGPRGGSGAAAAQGRPTGAAARRPRAAS